MTQRCGICAALATHHVGDALRLNRVCEACADRMIACNHPSGNRLQHFDEDGCGYYIWTCDVCGYAEIDAML